MTNFFDINRPLTQSEAKEWLESYLGKSLIHLVSMSKCGRISKVVCNTDRGEKETIISLPLKLKGIA